MFSASVKGNGQAMFQVRQFLATKFPGILHQTPQGQVGTLLGGIYPLPVAQVVP